MTGPERQSTARRSYGATLVFVAAGVFGVAAGAAAGTGGYVFVYAEGAYIHDCRHLHTDAAVAAPSIGVA